MMDSDYIVVYCTVPDEETAVNISRHLVENKLAACCNIVSKLRSIYFWNNEVCDDSELLLIIKTTATKYTELEAAIIKLHPYEVPEVIALPIIRGAKSYLSWVGNHVKK
jgi:periplasmic divalent cation tolerance protein